MSQRFVLDAWALLALIQGEEPAASRVRQLLDEAQVGDLELFVSIINVGEVYYRIGKVKGEQQARRALADIRASMLTMLPATDERVVAAATLKMGHPISYADGFVAATAAEINGVLVTGDPELERLQGQIQVEKLTRSTR